jgi:multiple sugar transport system ATP-binding protein
MTLADRIVVFNAGLVQQIGKPLDLYNHPKNLFVAGFLGAPKINLLQGKLSNAAEVEITLNGGATLHAAVDAAASKVGEVVTVGIRPEHLQLVGAAEPDAIAAKIVLLEHLGDQVLAYISIAGVAEELCMKLSGDTGTLNYGDTVHVQFPRAHCLLFDQDGNAYTRTHR